jgi:hypothetical protein
VGLLPFSAEEALPDNLRRAMTEGTTLTTRFFLSLAAVFQGLGYFFSATGWWSSPIYQWFNSFVPLPVWGALYLGVGMLGLWRAGARWSRPKLAWAINIITMLVWSSGLLQRLWLGPESLFSAHSALTLMALWCLLRTEATDRDSRTA